MKRIIFLFDDALEKFSRWGLVFSLFAILGLSICAIILRWLGTSLMWIEPLARHMVFLSAFLGGSLATSKNVHIKIDLFTKLVEISNSKVLKWVHKNLVTLFCFVTCIFLMKTSYEFFKVEREFGAPSFLNIHSAYLVAIIPFGIGLISLRFFNQLALGLINGEKREHSGL